MTGEWVRIQLPADYEVGKTLGSGQVFRWRRIDGRWHGADGGAVCRVSEDGSLESELPCVDWGRFFGRAPSELLNDVACVDSGLEELRETCGGLGLLRPADTLEVVLSFVCSANNNLKRIAGMVDSVAALGQDSPSSTPLLFPSLEAISKVPEETWRSRGFGYRARFVAETSAALLSYGKEYFDHLRSAGYEAAWKELQTLPGVGMKVADCICLYGLHFDEAAPIDTHLLSAYRKRLDGAVGALTASTYRRIGDSLRDRFGIRAGYAQLVLYYDQMARSKGRHSA